VVRYKRAERKVKNERENPASRGKPPLPNVPAAGIKVFLPPQTAACTLIKAIVPFSDESVKGAKKRVLGG
jgi:hypothetical protein